MEYIKTHQYYYKNLSVIIFYHSIQYDNLLSNELRYRLRVTE